MDQTKVDNFDELREQLMALEQSARAQTEAADRMKDEFLATLSHEIRTPLNSILGWVTLLRNGCLSPEEEQRALEVIERNARFQKQLINDLLDVSNIINGNLRLNVQPVMPEQAISKAVESVRPAAAAKGIRLEIELGSQAGPIFADIQRLQQMVWNLLVNAIKFTPEGGRVQLRMETMDSHVKIIVNDTGIGIKPELLPFVFDRFRQGDSSTTRRFGGLGLGLAIVRYMAEMHGGTVSVQSAGENCGTTFTIELPASAAHTAPEESQSRPLLKMKDDLPDREIHAELTDVRVLVVEDDPDSRRLLETILSRCHAEVQTASNGAEALVLLQGWRPDVIVSDIEMPEMDGVELIRCLRKRKNLARIPAAALTAYTRVEDRLRSLSAGFQMHLAKPVEPRELLAVVASLTGRFNHAKTVAETA